MVHAICRELERITTLDRLWGLVLLGLLIAQAFGQLGFSQPGHPLPLDHPHAELPVQFLVQLLVSGQFERLGSFLFGQGVYRCWQPAGPSSPGQSDSTGAASAVNSPGEDSPGVERSCITGTSITRPGRYRIAGSLLIGLLGIGLGLSFLLGSADLLLQYALLGFTLLYFMRQSVSALLIWMLGLALLTILVTSSLGLFTSVVTPGQVPVPFIQTILQPGEGLIQHPLWQWLLPGRSVSQGFSAFLSYELMLLGGLLLGKLGLLGVDHRLRVRLSLLQIGVLPAAFLLKGAWVALSLGLVSHPASLVTYQPVLLALSGFWGPLLLSGGYLLEFGLNAPLAFPGWTSWLGRVGQMSLTNYVLQSMLCPLLLCGYGLASSDQATSLGRAGIVLGIYGVQIGFSWVWLKRYRLGPLEWIIRCWIDAKLGSLNSVTPIKRS